MPGRWADLAEQSIVHALVAALVVEALLRVWRIESPRDRLILRLMALLQPLLVTPVLVFLPWRSEDEFHDSWTLFSGRHWEELRLLGVSLFDLFVLAMASIGLLLFLLDLWPLLRGRRRARGAPELPTAAQEAEVAELARGLGLHPAPPLRLLPLDAPALFCAGIRRPTILVSHGALALLDGAERRAALAHELAHLAGRDPLVSWLLMGVRALLFFNPVAQVLARAMARESERRADDSGSSVSGDRLALASALLRLHRASGGGPRPPLPFGASLEEPLRRARSRDVELRCRRLLDGPAPARSPVAGLRVALVALAVPILLVFVT
ncbi:MAG: M48 family metalloprotease [Deltaproteobacteria bacterium]|nr:M48 family metalloprotease [Deltaproteobacteria bacterium]